MVLEADEYGRAFHHYTPQVAVLTNCEPDHLDYYGSQAALEEAFLRYAGTVKPEGTLIAGIDSPMAVEIASKLQVQRPDVRIVTCSSRAAADYRITSSGEEYELATPNSNISGHLRQPGEHQRQNAAIALAALDIAGFDAPAAAQALATFNGVNRRFQLHGEANDVIVLDDYAHHPTEVTAAIAAARQRWPDRRIVILFQPHTYTRTSYLIDGFRTCFAGADVVYTVDTYAARTMSGDEMTSEQLASEIVTPKAAYAGSVEQSGALAADQARAGDLIVTMGAGDIDAAGPIILSRLGGGL